MKDVASVENILQGDVGRDLQYTLYFFKVMLWHIYIKLLSSKLKNTACFPFFSSASVRQCLRSRGLWSSQVTPYESQAACHGVVLLR